MKVNPADIPAPLIKADIIEPLKARSANRLNPMIRNEKVLLPPHKQVFPVRIVLVSEVWPARFPRQRFPGREAVPVLHVDGFGGAPGRIFGLKGVFGANDFAFEVGR